MPQVAGGVLSMSQSSSGGAEDQRGLSPQEKLRSLLAIGAPVTVVLAERDMDIESILRIRIGTILEFEVFFDSDLVLYVANEPIAQGQAVKIGENFGIRITSIKPIAERVQVLGGS